MAIDLDELRTLARTSLSAYASIMHHDWSPNWHHRVIARMLERFANKEPGWTKLILSLPPRSGKTELVSKLFPGWYMANHPHENVIVATYGGELSDDLGRKAREYASTEVFESITNLKISNDTNAITKWELTNRSTFFATSVGGALTGRGAHCLTGETLVTTEIGDICIRDLTFQPLPVKVLSIGATGLEWKNVKAISKREETWIYIITFEDGGVVEATGNHPFHVVGRGKTRTDELTPGDNMLRALRGGEEFTSICNEQEPVTGVQSPLLQPEVQPSPFKKRVRGAKKREGSLLQRLWGKVRRGEFKPIWEALFNLFAKNAHSSRESSHKVPSSKHELPHMQQGVYGALAGEESREVPDVLRKSVCGFSSLHENDKDRKPEVQGRECSCKGQCVYPEIIQEAAPGGSGEGQLQVRAVWSCGNRAQEACTSHKQCEQRQLHEQLGDPMCFMPHEDTQQDGFRVVSTRVQSVRRVRRECAVYDLEVEDNHNFFANGINTFNCLIIDDPLRNREDADSETTRDKIYNWFTSTAYTRLEKHGAVLVVLTRWHESDLAGRLIESNTGWREVTFPAIAEQDEEFRKIGDPLWPDKYPLEKMMEIKAQIGMRDWASLYQQRPAPADGDIFKSEWFRYYDQHPKDLLSSSYELQGVFQSWDTAVSARKTSARSACTTWAVIGKRFYLLDTFAAPLSFPELRQKAIELDRVWNPDLIYVEEQQTGRPLIDDLKRTMGSKLVPVRLRGDKEVRARAASVAFETGKVFLPRNEPWLDAYVSELISFPSGKFADRVDSTSQALIKLLKDMNTRGKKVSEEPLYAKAAHGIRSIYAR